MPEVSVIVPAYNAERFLTQTLESVCRQTFGDWELIVVDDGSSDGSVRIARHFAAGDARIRVHQQAHAGVGAARNSGLAIVHESVWAVMFLDADDVLEPGALDELVSALAAQPAAVGAHGQVRFIDAAERLVRLGEAEAWGRRRWALVKGKVVPWPPPLPTTLSVLVLLNRLRTPGCALLRRTAVEAVGGFDTDPRAAIAADYDLWLRLACRGDFAFVSKVVLSYRLHEHNLSRNLRKTDAARWYVHRRLAGAPDIAPEQRRVIKQGLRYARLLGAQYWFGWALQSVARGRLLSAAKQARHGLIELRHFYLDPPV